MHGHRPIGSDHFKEEAGRWHAGRETSHPAVPPHFQEPVTGVKLGAGGYLLQWYPTVKGPGYRRGRPRPVSPKKQRTEGLGLLGEASGKTEVHEQITSSQ